ncbi:MAG: hypothetical protein R2851_21000 [Caldilineaceae bacterium]
MAVTQYDLALEVVQDGLRRGIGNGCYVSDFYTAAEWALPPPWTAGMALSEMAARKSYLDGYGVRKAEDDYRHFHQPVHQPHRYKRHCRQAARRALYRRRHRRRGPVQ